MFRPKECKMEAISSDDPENSERQCPTSTKYIRTELLSFDASIFENKNVHVATKVSPSNPMNVYSLHIMKYEPDELPVYLLSAEGSADEVKKAITVINRYLPEATLPPKPQEIIFSWSTLQEFLEILEQNGTIKVTSWKPPFDFDILEEESWKTVTEELINAPTERNLLLLYLMKASYCVKCGIQRSPTDTRWNISEKLLPKITHYCKACQ